MNKELSELKELIAEQEKDEAEFQERTDKRMAKITALTAKIQAKAQVVPGPVAVTEHTRSTPRKERSDKGKSRKATTTEASAPPAQPGSDSEPTTIDPAYMQPDPEDAA